MARKLSLATALGEKKVVRHLLDNYKFADKECPELTDSDRYSREWTAVELQKVRDWSRV